MVKTKNYTYKLNNLFATNFEYNRYLKHAPFLDALIPLDFLEELKKDNKKMVFTIAPGKVIGSVK